ncbi:VOC family protein [Fertoebacter nigrum]|uniref:VOC family protein n=1 Tax=Fertoeibacter niger TaxID=2656921 RepID=A0A8X8H7U2_9RHOB|nr:VOC family protein [Fertoeibacter niger]
MPDLEAAVAHWQAVLGVAAGPVLRNEAQGVQMQRFDLAGAQIELLSPLGDRGPLAGYLTRNPRGGLHHLAFASTDLEADLARLLQLGVVPIGQPGRNVMGQRMVFLQPASMQGLLIELQEADAAVTDGG